MDFVGVLATVVAIFCLYALVIKPWALAGKIKGRLLAGDIVPRQTSYQDISNILKEMPYTEQVSVKSEGEAETKTGEKIGFIDLYFLNGFNGRIEIVPCHEPAGQQRCICKVTSFAKWEIESPFKVAKRYLEAEEVYRSLLHKLIPNYVEKYVGAENESKKIIFYRYLAIAIILGVFIYSAIPGILSIIGSNKMDEFVTQVSFRDYSSLSLADSLERFDSDGTWDFSVNSIKDIDIGKTETATWSGHGDICYENGTVETVPVTIQFNVFTEDKETTNIELDTCTIDGLSWSMNEENALGAQNIFQVVMSDTPISTDVAIANATSLFGFEMISFAQEGYFSGTTSNPSISTSDSNEDMYGDSTVTAPAEEKPEPNGAEEEPQYEYDGLGFLCEFENGSYNLMTITVDTTISDPNNTYVTIVCYDSTGTELVNYGDWVERLDTNKYQLNFDNGGSLVVEMIDEYTANVSSMGLNGPVQFDGIYNIGY